MKKVLLTIIFTLVVLISGFFIYIFSGSYDFSQLVPHNKLTKTIIGITTHSSINKRLKGIVVPDNLKDSAMLITGFQHYNEMCVSATVLRMENPTKWLKGCIRNRQHYTNMPEKVMLRNFSGL